MDPASFAFGLVAVFKDAYLTIKFIQKTIHTMNYHKTERDALTTQFNVQILRLTNFSRLFRDANGKKLDHELLEQMQDRYFVETILEVLKQLEFVLVEYSKLASSMDEDYKHSKDTLDLFGSDTSGEIPDPKGELGYEPEAPKQAQSKSTATTILRKFIPMWERPGPPQPPAPSTFAKAPKKTSVLPKHVQWLFSKPELERTLTKFREWNRELESLISLLLNGFGFFTNLDRQKRLQYDDDVNIFEHHLELNRLANNEGRDETAKADMSQDILISLKEAKAKEVQTRILTEYKRMVKRRDGFGRPDDRNIERLMRELHGPTLASLLRTAGKHSFRTLPLNSYARDDEKMQFIYLFDYPPGTSDREPRSLYDLILSSKREPKYKPELKNRFLVAQVMARAIGTFHSDGWLHKSIRAHAVKFFFLPGQDACNFEAPYLTDFELSRPVIGNTRLYQGGADPDYDVYRHPERYGEPYTSFTKTHDIYSLGVVLLEIGLWETAKTIYDDVVECEYKGRTPPGGLPPDKMRETFLQDAKDRLAHRMGSSYQQAVVSCLENDWDRIMESPSGLAKEFQAKVVQKVNMRASMA